MDVMDQLREAVHSSGESLAAVSKRANVPYSVLHGAMNSGCGLTVTTLQKLAAALEREVIIQHKTDTGRKA